MRAMRMITGVVVLAVACGGSKPKPATGPEPGNDHEEVGTVGAVENVGTGGGTGGAVVPTPDGGPPIHVVTTPPPDAGPPPAPYTFAIENQAAESELVFALDKGWQTALFAYSGKPPK